MQKRAMILVGVFGALAVAGCGDTAETEEAAAASLVRTVQEPAGDNCTNGGLAIQTGFDTDADGVLSETEVAETSYVCNGDDGEDGQDGQEGSAGATALVETAEAANCGDAGGTLVRVGLDASGDGTLQDDEVTQEQEICNPPEVANAPLLIDQVDVEPGDVCGGGGTTVRVGRDLDGDGELAEEEVESTLTECGPCPDGHAVDPADPNQCVVLTTIFFEGVIETITDDDGLDPAVSVGDRFWGTIEYPGLHSFQNTSMMPEMGEYSFTGEPGRFAVNMDGEWITSKTESELMFSIGNDFGYTNQDEYRAASLANEPFHGLEVESISIAAYDSTGTAFTSTNMRPPMDYAEANQHQFSVGFTDGLDNSTGPGPGPGPVAGSIARAMGTLNVLEVR